MNYSKDFNPNPTQEDMRKANYRHSKNSKRTYYAPFKPLNEEFRQVSQYFPEVRDWYWISNYGTLYSANGNYYIPPQFNWAGYIEYRLRRKEEYVAQGKPIEYTVAAQILVCTCFNGPKPGPKYQVNHKNFVRHNNYYENLEWLTPQENLDYSRAAGNYWTGNVYSSARYTEAQVRSICELLQAGITDPTTICMRVFGCEPNPGLYSLIRQIKSGKNWSKVSSDYEGIVDVEHRNFTADYIIHAMCRYMKDNPETAYTASLGDVLAYSGFYLNQFTDQERMRYRSALHQLRYKNAYRRIADQYGIPRQ